MKTTRTLPLQALLVVGILSAGLHAQNVGIGTSSPHPSARLHIEDNARGLLIPNVALTGTDDNTTVSGAATSLLVYNTATAGTGATAVTPGFYYWDGSQWVRLADGGKAWLLTGNAGTDPAVNFLGTTDAQPLCIRVDNQETFRFNPPGTSAPAWSIQRGGGNQRGLHAVDLQSARSAATQVASGYYSVIGGGSENIATGSGATVGGGIQDTASGDYSVIGGGSNNSASGDYATVGGGSINTASGGSATVGGGSNNTASGYYATVGGGVYNTASGDYSTIPGGHNLRVGTRSFGFSGQTTATQTDLSTNSNIAAFVDVDLWLYSRDFTNASQLRFYEAQAHGSGANYVALQAPTSLSANTTYTLPASAPATSAAWLQSDNTGAMSWRPVFYGTVSVDPPNIGANTSTTFTVTITNVQTGDLVFLTPPSTLEGALVFQGANVTAANTVTIRMRNVTAGAVDGLARTWSYMVIRP
jgi:hypothetical protein